jgi:outer membrane protein insertion porin family
MVFPLRINSQENIEYIKEKISDTLLSYLEENKGIEIIKTSSFEAELNGISKDDINETLVMKIGTKSGADFAIWGTLTKTKKSIRLDIRTWKIDAKSSIAEFYIEGEDSNRLISQLDELAERIWLILIEKERITRISVRGNNRIEDDAIKSQIMAKEGDLFSIKTLREDIKSIYNMGYFEDVNIDRIDSPEGKEIVFIVSEKPSVKRIEIHGNRSIKKEDIEEVTDIKVHTILDFTRIENNVKNILRLYKDKEYWSAEVDYRVYYLKTNEAILDFIITENKKAKIEEIVFVGNRAFSNGELRDVIKTNKEGFFSWLTGSGVLKENVLEQDMDKLSSFYRNNGYIDIKIGKPEIIHDLNRLNITIPVNEGKEFKIGKIDIQGEEILEKEALLKDLNTISGKIFNRKLLREDIAKITDKYTELGYAFTDVVPLTSIDRDTQLVDLTFSIRKGNKVYFERVDITGNDRTRDKVIRRELKILEGDLFNKKKLSRSYQRVYRLGYFEGIDFKTQRGSADDRLKLHIKVKERPTGTLSFGVGYSSVDKIIGMINLSQSNLFGKGQKLSVAARMGGKSQYYNLGFTEPWFFDTPISAGFDIYNVKREYTDYDKKAKGGDVRFGFPITEDYTRLYLTYKHEEVEIDNIEDDAAEIIKEQEGSSITNSITNVLIRDSRDSVIFPTKGSKNSISLEYAGGFLGGTNYFTKVVGSTTWYFPIFWDTVFMSRAIIGYAQGNKGRELPIFERFYLGGMNTVRGFETYSIGPKDPDSGDIIGGNKELIFNIEYIFPLLKEAGVKGVIFFDAGNAFDDDDDYSLDQLRTSVGLGVRWYSPMGPLRLEWGYNIDPKPDEDHSNWDFSIGTMF